MKEGIHPQYHKDAKIICAGCGAQYTFGATVPELRILVCSNCHPFFTGEEKIIDVVGRVEKFRSKYNLRLK